MKIQKKFISATIIVTTPIFFAFIVFVIISQHKEENKRFTNKIEMNDKLIELIFTEPLWNIDRRSAVKNCDALMVDEEIRGVQLFDELGNDIYNNSKNDIKADIIKKYEIYKGTLKLGEIKIEYSKYEIEKKRNNTIAGAIFALIFLLMTVSSVTYFEVLLITKPIKKIIESIENIRRGEYNKSLNVDGSEEIRKLSDSINRLIAEIKYKEENTKKVIFESLMVAHRSEIEKIKNQMGEDREIQIARLNTIIQNSYRDIKILQNQLLVYTKNTIPVGAIYSLLDEVFEEIDVYEKELKILNGENNNKVNFEEIKQTENADFSAQFQEKLKVVNRIQIPLKNIYEQINCFNKIVYYWNRENVIDFDLNSIIHEIIVSLNPFLKKNNYKILFENSEKFEVRSSPSFFYQVFMNLIIFSVDRGVEGRKDGIIEIITKEKNNKIEINYIDNCTEIKSEELEKIFEPSFVLKQNSIAVGLEMFNIYSLVTQKIKGCIVYKNDSEKGNVFEIIFEKQNY